MKVQRTDATQVANSRSGQKATAILDVTPKVPKLGAAASFRITVKSGGRAPSGFEDLHTKKMHLIAVSEDLTDFVHVQARASTSRCGML